MNEIITKLDEIEKKAESILTEAAAEKEKMLKQLEFDKREMDGRYTSMRQKQEEEIKQQILSEAETKITRQREHYEAAKRRLEEDFAQKKDSLAEEIFESIISP
jgi:V/A-type H+-transporting ATPase subunit G/H